MKHHHHHHPISTNDIGNDPENTVVVLSDYERRRAQNIVRNNHRLRTLGLLSDYEEHVSNAMAWRQPFVPVQFIATNSKRQDDDTTTDDDEMKKTTKSRWKMIQHPLQPQPQTQPQRSRCSKKVPTAPAACRKSQRLQGRNPTNDTQTTTTTTATTTSTSNTTKGSEHVQESRPMVRQRQRHLLDGMAHENPKNGTDQEPFTASYDHCLMRVRTMTAKGLANRIKAIERAAGKHCVIKMTLFHRCLEEEGMWELAEFAHQALDRLQNKGFA